MSTPLSRITARISLYLPRLGLSALILCLASGIVLAFQYRPMGNVFQNVESITTHLPYGWFFRQLHYGSGQVFVILMLLHTLDHFVRRRYRMYAPRQWTSLVASLILCFYTLFTGFILKGDQEGLFAGRIFMNILSAVPVAGGALSRLFIGPGESFFFLPYLYHCFFLPLLIIYLMRGHIREWLPNQRFLMIAGTGLFLYALLIESAVDIPPEAATSVVKGPWFFLGIQTLLRSIPPALAGLVIPGLFTGCLLVLPALGGLSARKVDVSRDWAFRAVETCLYYLLVVAILLYGLLTVNAGIWGP